MGSVLQHGFLDALWVERAPLLRTPAFVPKTKRARSARSTDLYTSFQVDPAATADESLE